MPIELTDRLSQQNRLQNLSTSAFFHLANAVDIDFSVEAIIGSGEVGVPILYQPNKKYVLLGPPNQHASLSVPGAQDGDIVIYYNNVWSLYVDVSNPETSAPIIYDKRTERYYHHTPTNGWIPIINSKSSLDGGTFDPD
jgi:hypothetical protein